MTEEIEMKICMVAFGPIEDRTGGYEVRCSQIIQSLVELGHKVYVLEFPTTIAKRKKTDLKENRMVEFVHLRGNEHMKSKLFKTLAPPLKENTISYLFLFVRIELYSIAELSRSMETIKDCEVILVESVFFPFAMVLAKLLRRRVILDTHYMGKLQAQKYKKKHNLHRLVIWDSLERFASSLSDFVVVVSDEEKAFAKNEYGIPEEKLAVIPVTIEPLEVRISQQMLKKAAEEWNLQNKIVVTFLGTLEASPNRDAVNFIVQELAPSIYRKNREVVFLVIGKGKEQFRHYTSPNVIFTGFIKDVNPLLQLSDVCIAPMRIGSGVKTKVLEYMSHGKPVLTTPEGIQGIKAQNVDSVIVSNIENYRDKLIEVIENLDELKGKGKNGQEIVRKQYSLSTLKKRLSEILTLI